MCEKSLEFYENGTAPHAAPNIDGRSRYWPHYRRINNAIYSYPTHRHTCGTDFSNGLGATGHSWSQSGRRTGYVVDSIIAPFSADDSEHPNVIAREFGSTVRKCLPKKLLSVRCVDLADVAIPGSGATCTGFHDYENEENGLFPSFSSPKSTSA
jgi:hypothetical protein